MAAAILFGKINRIQSHANVEFCNAVCLIYAHEDGRNLSNDDNGIEISPIEEQDEDTSWTKSSMLQSMVRTNTLICTRTV
jgi:hypothetical protein